MNTFTKAKFFVAGVLCHPLVGRTLCLIFRRKIPGGGFRADVRNPSVSLANVAKIFWRIYEKPEASFVRRYLDPNLDVIELGSSLGIISLNIMGVQHPDRQLVCVEANPHLIRTINDNIRLNWPQRKVKVLNRAVDYSGRTHIEFLVDEGNLGSHIIEGSSDSTVAILTTTLSALLEEHNMKKFALVTDIEGAEVGLLLEDSAALANCCQIIIELHPTRYGEESYDVSRLKEIIESVHGFNLVNRRNDVLFFSK